MRILIADREKVEKALREREIEHFDCVSAAGDKNRSIYLAKCQEFSSYPSLSLRPTNWAGNTIIIMFTRHSLKNWIRGRMKALVYKQTLCPPVVIFGVLWLLFFSDWYGHLKWLLQILYSPAILRTARSAGSSWRMLKGLSLAHSLRLSQSIILVTRFRCCWLIVVVFYIRLLHLI